MTSLIDYHKKRVLLKVCDSGSIGREIKDRYTTFTEPFSKLNGLLLGKDIYLKTEVDVVDNNGKQPYYHLYGDIYEELQKDAKEQYLEYFEVQVRFTLIRGETKEIINSQVYSKIHYPMMEMNKYLDNSSYDNFIDLCIFYDGFVAEILEQEGVLNTRTTVCLSNIIHVRQQGGKSFVEIGLTKDQLTRYFQYNSIEDGYVDQKSFASYSDLSTLLDIVEHVKGYMNRFNQAQLITEPELCTAVFCQALRDMSIEDRINEYLKLKIIFLHYENEVQKVYRIFTLKSNSQVHVLTTVIQNPPPPPPTFWEKIKRYFFR